MLQKVILLKGYSTLFYSEYFLFRFESHFASGWPMLGRRLELRTELPERWG